MRFFLALLGLLPVSANAAQLEIILDGGIITGIARPEQWGGPSNPCPSCLRGLD